MIKIKFVQNIRDLNTGELYLRRIRLLPMVITGPVDDEHVRYAPFNLFLHIFYRSDHDRALHDHPWPSVSFKLWGAAVEHYWVDDPVKNAPPGYTGFTTQRYIPWLRPIYRPAMWRHRIELIGPAPLVTLFFVGFKQRTWGFWPDGEFVRWTEYLGYEEDAHVD